MVLVIIMMMKYLLLKKKHAQFKTSWPKNDILYNTKMTKIDTLFLTSTNTIPNATPTPPPAFLHGSNEWN